MDNEKLVKRFNVEITKADCLTLMEVGFNFESNIAGYLSNVASSMRLSMAVAEKARQEVALYDEQRTEAEVL